MVMCRTREQSNMAILARRHRRLTSRDQLALPKERLLGVGLLAGLLSDLAEVGSVGLADSVDYESEGQ